MARFAYARRPLDRVGGEVARATSIVRYAPNSKFSPHLHTGGEEFLVLEGVFQDEHGDYPTGTYVRNPPGSKHTPGSDEGCIIFVKLWQFLPDDKAQFSIDTRRSEYHKSTELGDYEVLELFEDSVEKVRMVRLQPGQGFTLDVPGGAELLVLDGELMATKKLVRGDWLRLPLGSELSLAAGDQGAHFWLKSGHLQVVEEQIERVLNN